MCGGLGLGFKSRLDTVMRSHGMRARPPTCSIMLNCVPHSLAMPSTNNQHERILNARAKQPKTRRRLEVALRDLPYRLNSRLLSKYVLCGYRLILTDSRHWVADGCCQDPPTADKRFHGDQVKLRSGFTYNLCIFPLFSALQSL